VHAAAAATFSRFIPTVKARFDYGVTIFILTYSLVAVSGYRVDQLAALAQQRVSTIGIGIFMCLAVNLLICPVWSGAELHLLTSRNMDKLADAVEACVEDYFAEAEEAAARQSKSSDGYKCVLNSKASEDSHANLARWEPAHGRFGFRHPYGQRGGLEQLRGRRGPGAPAREAPPPRCVHPGGRVVRAGAQGGVVALRRHHDHVLLRGPGLRGDGHEHGRAGAAGRHADAVDELATLASFKQVDDDDDDDDKKGETEMTIKVHPLNEPDTDEESPENKTSKA